MESHRLWIKYKQGCDQRFILVLLQAAALPGSDAGSDSVEPTSGFVIIKHPTMSLMTCSMQAMGHAVKTWSVVRSMAPHSQFGKRARPHCAWTNGIAQHQYAGDLTLTQAVQSELIPTGLVLALVNQRSFIKLLIKLKKNKV